MGLGRGKIPAGIVVQVDDAHLRRSLQTALNKLVICCEVGCIEAASEVVVEQVLPADWQAEGVETVVVCKMLHLCNAIIARVDRILFRLVRAEG